MNGFHAWNYCPSTLSEESEYLNTKLTYNRQTKLSTNEVITSKHKSNSWVKNINLRQLDSSKEIRSGSGISDDIHWITEG